MYHSGGLAGRLVNVTDTFGERRLIEPTAKARADGGPWRMFHISEDASAAGAKSNLEALFLAPVIFAVRGWPPNWRKSSSCGTRWPTWPGPVERVVEGPSGMPIDRPEQWNRKIADVARDTGVPTVIEPQGQLLASHAAMPLKFYAEQVPREGRRVQRLPMLARWSGRTTACWVGRRSRVGRGEGSSGLRYDVAERT